MNKHILSIALLLSTVPEIFSMTVVPDCAVICPRWQTNTQVNTYAVLPLDDITIKTHLTVTPTNHEKWALTDYNGLELVRYEFKRSHLVGSAGTQEWVFRAPKTGKYQVIFKRNNETKVITLFAYLGPMWFEAAKPTKQIEF